MQEFQEEVIVFKTRLRGFRDLVDKYFVYYKDLDSNLGFNIMEYKLCFHRLRLTIIDAIQGFEENLGHILEIKEKISNNKFYQTISYKTKGKLRICLLISTENESDEQINSVIKQVENAFNDFSLILPDCDPRFALICYKNGVPNKCREEVFYNKQFRTLQEVRFDLENLSDKVFKFVDSGLQIATEISWDQEHTNLIIHFAPVFMTSKPNLDEYRKYFHALKSCSINYLMLKLNNKTDEMFTKFKRHYEEAESLPEIPSYFHQSYLSEFGAFYKITLFSAPTEKFEIQLPTFSITPLEDYSIDLSVSLDSRTEEEIKSNPSIYFMGNLEQINWDPSTWKKRSFVKVTSWKPFRRKIKYHRVDLIINPSPFYMGTTYKITNCLVNGETKAVLKETLQLYDYKYLEQVLESSKMIREAMIHFKKDLQKIKYPHIPKLYKVKKIEIDGKAYLFQEFF